MEVHDNDRANVNATFVSHVFNCRYSSSANKVQFVDDCNGSIVNLIPFFLFTFSLYSKSLLNLSSDPDDLLFYGLLRLFKLSVRLEIND